MAAIVADKLNNQKLNGGPEFQSDSNIADSLRPNHQRLTTLRERRLSMMKVCIECLYISYFFADKKTYTYINLYFMI